MNQSCLPGPRHFYFSSLLSSRGYRMYVSRGKSTTTTTKRRRRRYTNRRNRLRTCTCHTVSHVMPTCDSGRALDRLASHPKLHARTIHLLMMLDPFVPDGIAGGGRGRVEELHYGSLMWHDGNADADAAFAFVSSRPVRS